MSDDLKWFRKRTTKMIHMTAEFPSPKVEGHSQCGQSLFGMDKMERREVRRAKDYEFCRKCTQLLGLS